MMRRRFTNCRGMCLAELMIALAAGAVVLAAALQSLTQLERRFSAQQETIGRHQDLRIGLAVMQDELRSAGIGASGTVLLTAQQQEVAFLANLDGATAVLTEPASPGQQELRVHGADDWPKGKRIVLCADDYCAEARLARQGQRQALSVSQPLEQSFPAGSRVWPASYLRYYVGKDREGKSVLMRQVEGGANPLIGETSRAQFRYLDGAGQPTKDLARVARVRLELAVGGEQRLIASEIGLHAL